MANTPTEYAKPDALVSTGYVVRHLGSPEIRVVEVDVDTSAYERGHIPGSIAWNWSTELCDTVVRDIIPRNKLEQLMSRSGIGHDTTVILYGDNNNWFAAWAFWQLKMYGYRDVRLMDGGRKKWVEEGRILTVEQPTVIPARYVAARPDFSVRAFLPEVRQVVRQHAYGNGRSNGTILVDVRSPQEYTGEVLAPPNLPETCQRGGHIPGAKNVPWAKACNDDGTFKDYDDLRALYQDMGVTSDKRVITYCRIGERSSHSWFALTYLLGYQNVRNYDGSWTEWGNLVGAPVETS
ncbi:MAG: sulfurtransferase [Chloroflexia bacterium]